MRSTPTLAVALAVLVGPLVARAAADDPPPLVAPREAPPPVVDAPAVPLQDEGRPLGDDPAEGPVHEALRPPGAGAEPVRVAKAPPPPIVERPGADRPSPEALWIKGYWGWDPARDQFVWVTGVWRVPPPGQLWVDGSWRRDATGWVRVPGTWSDRSPTIRPASSPFAPPEPTRYTVARPTPPTATPPATTTPAPPPRPDLPAALGDEPQSAAPRPEAGEPPVATANPTAPAPGRPAAPAPDPFAPTDPRRMGPVPFPPAVPPPVVMIGPDGRPVLVYPTPPPYMIRPAVPRFYGFPGARLTNRILDRVLP